MTPNGNGNGGGLIKGLLIANGIGLFGAIGWLLVLSYYAGQRSNQMDINTSRIVDIDTNGSPGLKIRMEEINRRLERIEIAIDRLDHERLRH